MTKLPDDRGWRCGRHQPRNLYRNGQYIGVVFDPDDAAYIAEILNDADYPDLPPLRTQPKAS